MELLRLAVKGIHPCTDLEEVNESWIGVRRIEPRAQRVVEAILLGEIKRAGGLGGFAVIAERNPPAT